MQICGRAQRSSFLVVLLDRGVLVVGVHAGGDPGGDHPGPEPSRGAAFAAAVDPPAEDQADLRSAQVEVVAEHLFEEDPPGHRLVQHLGQRELGLQDRQVVPVPGGPIGRRERVRQDRQPLTKQRVDLIRSQLLADGLQRRRVVHVGERVVHRGEHQAGLGRLPLGPVVAIQAQPSLRPPEVGIGSPLRFAPRRGGKSVGGGRRAWALVWC